MHLRCTCAFWFSLTVSLWSESSPIDYEVSNFQLKFDDIDKFSYHRVGFILGAGIFGALMKSRDGVATNYRKFY